MKQILLAIDGNVPSRPIFQYAADLCENISARLCILQFIKNRKGKLFGMDNTTDYTSDGHGMARSVNTRAKIASKHKSGLETYWNFHINKDGTIGNIETGEADMTGQGDKSFAGILAPLKQMLEKPSCPVPYSVALSDGCPENVLSGYVDFHHDIVIAVFDPSHDHAPASSRIKALKKRLGVPLVVINSTNEKSAI